MRPPQRQSCSTATPDTPGVPATDRASDTAASDLRTWYPLIDNSVLATTPPTIAMDGHAGIAPGEDARTISRHSPAPPSMLTNGTIGIRYRASLCGSTLSATSGTPAHNAGRHPPRIAAKTATATIATPLHSGIVVT